MALVVVAAATGFAAGLLANSGGFLLAPLYVAVLRLPLKQAFACSLAVSAVLAIPGTRRARHPRPHRLEGGAGVRRRVGAAVLRRGAARDPR